MDVQNQHTEVAARPDPNKPTVITPSTTQSDSSASMYNLPTPMSPHETIDLSVAPATEPTSDPVRPIEQPAHFAAAASEALPVADFAFPAAANDSASNPYADPETRSAPAERQDVSWLALEFAARPKQTSWYIVLAAITAVAVGLAYAISDIITAIVVLVCSGLFGFMASRQPRTLSYALDAQHINIGNKQYPYSDFSSFSIFEDGDYYSVDLAPLKRFAPVLTISYNHENEEDILEVLAQHLPFAAHSRTAIDQLMHRIGF